MQIDTDKNIWNNGKIIGQVASKEVVENIKKVAASNKSSKKKKKAYKK